MIMPKKKLTKLSENELLEIIDNWEPKEIVLKCDGDYDINYKELVAFQGDLKSIANLELYKLCVLILRCGFFVPVLVWEEGAKIIDGHQRLSAIKLLAGRGFEIPGIPVNIINAANEEEARAMVLAASSTYAKFQKPELYEWLDNMDDDITELLNLTDIENDIDIDSESKELEYKEKLELIVTCETEDQLQSLYEKLIRAGYECKVSTL